MQDDLPRARIIGPTGEEIHLVKFGPPKVFGTHCLVCDMPVEAFGTPGTAYLHQLWHDMRDHGRPLMQAFAYIVQALYAFDIVTYNEAHAWLGRVQRCPEAGQEHVGGRAWCAYCGDLPRAAFDNEGTTTIEVPWENGA